MSDCTGPVLCPHVDISYAVWWFNVLELHDNLSLPVCFHLGAMQILVAAVKYSLINNNRKVTLDYYSTLLLWRQLHLPVYNIFFSPEQQRKSWQAELPFHFQLGKHWQALKDGFEEKPWTSKDVNYSWLKKTSRVLRYRRLLTAVPSKQDFCYKTPHHMCFFWLWLII